MVHNSTTANTPRCRVQECQGIVVCPGTQQVSARTKVHLHDIGRALSWCRRVWQLWTCNHRCGQKQGKAGQQHKACLHGHSAGRSNHGAFRYEAVHSKCTIPIVLCSRCKVERKRVLVAQRSTSSESSLYQMYEMRWSQLTSS